MEDAHTPLGPAKAKERLVFLDTLRGLAVMAIFVVNIKAMAMPLPYYLNPLAWGHELDQTLAVLQRFLIDDKWRSIFSMLYGAGLFMLAERGEFSLARSKLLARRNVWLLVFGFFHMVMIWVGDILLLYGASGLLTMMFIESSARRQGTLAALFLAGGIAMTAAFAALPLLADEARAAIEPILWDPSSDVSRDDIAFMQGGVGAQIAHRASSSFFILITMVVGGMLITTVGLMLLGAALFRWGLLKGQVRAPLALLMGSAALAAAWGLDAFQLQRLAASADPFLTHSSMAGLAAIDGIFGAIGYSSLLAGLLTLGLRMPPIAAAGRMAFTNYIASSLIGTTLAGGHAFGLFGEVKLTFLMLVVGVSLIGMLIWSPLWLRYFRFGPLEWLWRSLVYQQRQPIRRAL